MSFDLEHYPSSMTIQLCPETKEVVPPKIAHVWSNMVKIVEVLITF